MTRLPIQQTGVPVPLQINEEKKKNPGGSDWGTFYNQKAAEYLLLFSSLTFLPTYFHFDFRRRTLPPPRKNNRNQKQIEEVFYILSLGPQVSGLSGIV